MEQVEIDVPKFNIAIDGDYVGTITEQDIINNNIPVYEFYAGINTKWGVQTNRYCGVKLKDVLEALQITNYSGIMFKALGNANVIYGKSELSDLTFLVFYRDGAFIYSERQHISLIAVDKLYRFSLEELKGMDISSQDIIEGDPKLSMEP